MMGLGRICSVEECNRSHRAKGYCMLHYARVQAYGDPLMKGRKRTQHERLCIVEGCGRTRYSKGYCRKHHARVLRNGNPLEVKHEFHGLSSSKTYHIWTVMKTRNTNVCPRWQKSFLAFYKDMGLCPPLQHLELMDRSGDYEPSNCRWLIGMRRGRKLSILVARQIRQLYSTGNYVYPDLGRMFNVDQSAISLIVNGKRWNEETISV